MGILFVGVLRIRALLCGVYIGVPDIRKLLGRGSRPLFEAQADHWVFSVRGLQQL